MKGVMSGAIAKYTLKRHDSAEAILSAHWSVPESELPECGMGGVDIHGDPLPDTPLPEIIETMKEAGLWGYADVKKMELHYWLDPAKADRADAVNLFAHEILHLTKHKPDDDDVECETEAMLIGDIAQKAFETMAEVMGEQR